MSVGHSGTVIVSMQQCGTSDRECATVQDSDRECRMVISESGTVLDSASKHDMDAMAL